MILNESTAKYKKSIYLFIKEINSREKKKHDPPPVHARTGTGPTYSQDVRHTKQKIEKKGAAFNLLGRPAFTARDAADQSTIAARTLLWYSQRLNTHTLVLF